MASPLVNAIHSISSYHNYENPTCTCTGCTFLIYPARSVAMWWRRFGFSLKENLQGVFSPENWALGISAVVGAFFYGALFAGPIYLLGDILADSILIFFDQGKWNLHSAWALSSACTLLLKDITFIVQED
jgi:hypothetical protein